nr:protein Diedel-like [Drosophila takahashii]
MTHGRCEDAGGFGEDPFQCDIWICADGNRKKGTFCGQGWCNIFGCNCECIKGEWTKTFKEINKEYGIEINEIIRVPVASYVFSHL